MARRSRAEVEAENLVLYRELEAIRDRVVGLLDDDEADREEPDDDVAPDSDDIAALFDADDPD